MQVPITVLSLCGDCYVTDEGVEQAAARNVKGLKRALTDRRKNKPRSEDRPGLGHSHSQEKLVGWPYVLRTRTFWSLAFVIGNRLSDL